ncbi:hypothetical protein [Streptomyces sp. MMBL 11-3]|uniref:hypothetical protein n=1 Tax=Streptomyces sp. MMBL 11-3 TaxID=3382639 RepID=UPI0039B48C15
MSSQQKIQLLRREEVSRASLRRRQPVAEGNTVLVYVDRRGRRFVADRPLTAAEIWWSTPSVVYVVDTGVHHEAVEFILPAKEEAFSFRATLELSWQIQDPDEAVKTRIPDAQSVYRPYLQHQLRRISRNHGVENSADAEHEINDEFATGPRLLGQGLFLLNSIATLSLDSEARHHIAERTKAKWNDETIRRNHTSKLEHTDRQVSEAKAEHDIAQLRAGHERERRQQEEEHRLALQKLRLEHYDEVLQNERWGLIKLRLDSNPDDVDGVINLIMQQKQVDYEGARGILMAGLNGGVVTPKQVAGVVAQATDFLTQGLRRNADWQDEEQPEISVAEAKRVDDGESADSELSGPDTGPEDDTKGDEGDIPV